MYKLQWQAKAPDPEEISVGATLERWKICKAKSRWLRDPVAALAAPWRWHLPGQAPTWHLITGLAPPTRRTPNLRSAASGGGAPPYRPTFRFPAASIAWWMRCARNWATSISW